MSSIPSQGSKLKKWIKAESGNKIESVTCPKCGYENSLGVNNCEKCGFVLIQKDEWAEIDDKIKKTTDHAMVAYRTNYFINLIIVAIGIIFLGSSIYFSFTRGLDTATLTYAGIGIADFVALFLVGPQKNIQQLIGDLDQIMVIHRTWMVQRNLIDNQQWKGDKWINPKDLAEVTKINEEYAKIADKALEAIEKYVGVPVKSS